MSSPIQEARTRATRARIAETALELFVSQGFAETTIDEIAAEAGVGRRTVFRYFPTKEAMLFDQLAVRREVAVQRLVERPMTEPPLVSLHAVIREWCSEGYDRRFLGQIRAVLATEPRRVGEQLSDDIRAFEGSVIAVLEQRVSNRRSHLELHAVTRMACGWFVTAAHLYLIEGHRSLVKTFDDVVAACARSSARDLGDRAFGAGSRPSPASSTPRRRTG